MLDTFCKMIYFIFLMLVKHWYRTLPLPLETARCIHVAVDCPASRGLDAAWRGSRQRGRLRRAARGDGGASVAPLSSVSLFGFPNAQDILGSNFKIKPSYFTAVSIISLLSCWLTYVFIGRDILIFLLVGRREKKVKSNLEKKLGKQTHPRKLWSESWRKDMSHEPYLCWTNWLTHLWRIHYVQSAGETAISLHECFYFNGNWKVKNVGVLLFFLHVRDF